jgi:peptidoglycan/LPS O-acetylase OafA/YrhL
MNSSPPSVSSPHVDESLGYLAELDGLRGIAVLSVMIFHSGVLVGGWLGVDVFFVLSGFLITRLLVGEYDRTGRINLGYFYARRALRLLPALVTLVTVLALVLLVTTGREYRSYLLLYVSAVLFYFANWVEPFGFPLGWGFGHTWSLAIEEQFYLLWPLVLLTLLRFVRRRLVIAFIVPCAALGVVAYRALLTRAGSSPLRLFEGSDTHADPLLIGCALALLTFWDLLPGGHVARQTSRWLAGLSMVGLVGLFLRARLPVDYVEYGASTAAAVCTALIITDLLGPNSLLAPALRNGLLVRTGRISYGLYLWHYPIFFALGIQTYGSVSAPGTIAAGWVGTAGAALVSFYVIESPALRLKARFAPSRSVATRAASSRRSPSTPLSQQETRVSGPVSVP